MMGKYRYFLKNTFLLIISNFSSKILVFLLVPIYTSALSTSEFGTYDLISTTLSLILPIVTLNICEAVMRFTMEKDVNNNEIVSIAIRIISISILITGIIIATNDFFNLWSGLAEYSIYVFGFFIVNLLYQFVMQFAKGIENVKGVAIAGIISTILTVGLNVLFLLYYNLHLKGFYLSYIIGQLVPFIYLSIRVKLYRYFSFKINKKLQHTMILYSIPLIFNSLGWWVNSVSDRYVVTWLCGISLNGIYSVSYKIPSILNTFQNIFNQSWQISAIKEYDNSQVHRFYNNILSYINSIMSLACATLIISSRLLAYFLYSNDFYIAWKYVPFLLISGVINSASGVLGPILSAGNNTKALGKSAVYGAVTNIILNIGLVYVLGVQGAAIATMISSIVIFECRKKELHSIVTFTEVKKVYLSWICLTMQGIVMICIPLLIGYLIQVSIIICLLVLYKTEIINCINGIVGKLRNKKKIRTKP